MAKLDYDLRGIDERSRMLQGLRNVCDRAKDYNEADTERLMDSRTGGEEATGDKIIETRPT